MAATEPGQQDNTTINARNTGRRPAKRPHLAREIVETLVLTLLIFLVIRFVIQSYHIDGASMQPGLDTNELVVVNKIAYMFHPPERGDVIVFHNPHNTQEDFIKRVIGLPGDTVRSDSTHIWVNDTQLNESAYISQPANLIAKVWTVPANSYFVMGDNRPNSEDSRSPNVDMIPKDYIIGKAVMVFWPLNAIHFIDTFRDTYKDIKEPGSNQGTPTPTQGTPGAKPTTTPATK
jgi:signal peptidase I